jgi:hypothetical protein
MSLSLSLISPLELDSPSQTGTNYFGVPLTQAPEDWQPQNSSIRWNKMTPLQKRLTRKMDREFDHAKKTGDLEQFYEQYPMKDNTPSPALTPTKQMRLLDQGSSVPANEATSGSSESTTSGESTTFVFVFVFVFVFQG